MKALLLFPAKIESSLILSKIRLTKHIVPVGNFYRPNPITLYELASIARTELTRYDPVFLKSKGFPSIYFLKCRHSKFIVFKHSKVHEPTFQFSVIMQVYVCF